MKSFLKYSKFTIGTLIMASAFVACGDDDDEAAYTIQYSPNTSNISKAGSAVDLGLSIKWADRNIGAATESDNGLLFVWGDVTGNVILPTESTYSTNPMSAADLFERYKGNEAIGYLYDTTSVSVVVGEVDSAKCQEILEHLIDSLGNVRIEVLYVPDTIQINKIDSTEVKYYECSVGSFSAENGASLNNVPLFDLTSNPNYDAATKNWGSAWRMPTKDELNELLNKCEWEFVGNGYKVTGPSGNSIMLPAAGYRYGEEVVGTGVSGYYTSGSILGNYHFPSMTEQSKGELGTIGTSDIMPNTLIYNHGNFTISKGIYNNIVTNIAVSIRPVSE